MAFSPAIRWMQATPTTSLRHGSPRQMPQNHVCTIHQKPTEPTAISLSKAAKRYKSTPWSAKLGWICQHPCSRANPADAYRKVMGLLRCSSFSGLWPIIGTLYVMKRLESEGITVRDRLLLVVSFTGSLSHEAYPLLSRTVLDTNAQQSS